MGIFSKLLFWKKKELPSLPEENTQDLPPQMPLEEPRSRFEPPPQFEQPLRSPQFESNFSQNNEFQVVSSKLDVLNAKLEVINERLTNLEKDLNSSRERW
tara:strand:+ start:757 stop:1056 length:300 start_codon:yes stop_codon:yes gene_type:complete